jgi:hypothetical protein
MARFHEKINYFLGKKEKYTGSGSNINQKHDPTSMNLTKKYRVHSVTSPQQRTRSVWQRLKQNLHRRRVELMKFRSLQLYGIDCCEQ